MAYRTGLVYDPIYLDHDPGSYLIRYTDDFPFGEVEPHPSGPVVARRTHKLLQALGYLDHLTPIPMRTATNAEIEYVHTPEMRTRVERISKHGGDVGIGAPIAAGGEHIARLAAGGAIAAVDAVMTGDVRNAFGLIRPPGHHATREQSLGFCVYNNIAIAARHAQRVHGLQRIAIVDWDVHHGNGTQDIFWDDPDVLFISLHQDNLFPLNWGKVGDTGADGAQGRTVNVPLPPGSGNAAYLAAMQEIVLPILEAFAPELILISAGQDASVQDPLGRMTVTVPAYLAMTRMIMDVAENVCDSRLVVLQEGGYSNYYAPFCAAAIFQGLMDDPPEPVMDPYSPRSEVQPGAISVSGDQRAAIDAVVSMQQEWWPVE
ncbi:MAG: class II histone deacetylase [Thermomicrobiales bacterium]|nr:class II histone deacetylase [Thermomicrobiales bacterium]